MTEIFLNRTKGQDRQTQLYKGYQHEADALDNNMQSPVGQVHHQLFMRQLQPADEKDERHRPVQNGELRPDDASLGCYV